MLYEMLYGPTPFECEDKKKMQLFIEQLEVTFPEKFEVSQESKSLIKRLLEKDPEKRQLNFPNGLGGDSWFYPKQEMNLSAELDLTISGNLTYFYPEHTSLGKL